MTDEDNHAKHPFQVMQEWFAAHKSDGPGINSLHHYWVRADGARNLMEKRFSSVDGIHPQVVSSAQFLYNAMALETFYGLVYVLVEGYQQLKLSDASIDALLERKDMVDLLRRFRNVIFHFQVDFLDERLNNFLSFPGSENWMSELYRAFRSYFEREMPLKELASAMSKYLEDIGEKQT